VLLLGCLLGLVQAANWALLVAGSNGYMNYRHQADVAHAYQLLTRKGGFPVSNVVTMMYNDIVNAPENPKKGQLFNHPNGTDVYKGITIDYQGQDVNAKNFYNILSGNKAALKGIGSGKVIDSNAQDNIFIYYSDHGAFGLICMPTGPYLYAKDLNTTINDMYAQKKFSKLVFYLEACESGSMFANILAANENVWAITAANPQESSYAFYYDQTLGTYLGDEFSVRWMEDSDSEALDASYTLTKQFGVVQNEVKQSHVCLYGDQDLGKLPVNEFQEFDKASASDSDSVTVPFYPSDRENTANVRNLELEILFRKLLASKSRTEKETLRHLIREEHSRRNQVDIVFSAITRFVTTTKRIVAHPFGYPKDFECLRESVESFEATCGTFSTYGLQYARTLSALCDLGYDVSQIASGIQHACGGSRIY